MEEAIAKVLLDSGAIKVNATDGDGKTALHWACDNLYLETIRLLLNRGANLEAKDGDGSTPLMIIAVQSESPDEDEKEIIVKFLLDSGAEANVAENDGNTALHWACYHKHLGMVQLLLHHGANLEAKDGHHGTPLYWACSSDDNLDVVKELVQQWGADIFAKDASNKTPFDEANVLRGNEAVTSFLLGQYEEKVWQQEGRLALHAILREATNLENSKVQLPIGTLTVDELLGLLGSIHLRNPALIRSQDRNRSLPLHVACRANSPLKVLQFFADQDLSTLHAENSAGSLPVHEACRGGASLEKIKILVEKGGVATLDARDDQGALPVHVLCQSNPSVDVVKFLLNLNPGSISEETSAGALPFMLACKGSASESVLQFLLTKYPKALDDTKTYYSLYPN